MFATKDDFDTARHLQRVADWHGEQAAKAYRKRDMKTYIRHARRADRLWNAL